MSDNPNPKCKPQNSPPSSLKREVPTWFQNDGCSEEKKLTHNNSFSCPVTPVTTATACTTETELTTYSPTSISRNQLTLPPVSCHCTHSHTQLGLGYGTTRIPIPLIPLAPSWLVYRDSAGLIGDPQLNSPSASPSSECSSPLDLSCKSSSYDGFESDADCESPGSILRSLLSPTLNGAPPVPHACVPHAASPGSSPLCAPVGIQVQVEDCDKDAPHPQHCTTLGCHPDTPVRLAKKNIYPVTSRVSQWLTQMVRFALEVPSFKALAQHEQVHVLQHAWHRLLLLCMAEDNFLFAVSASPSPVPPNAVHASPNSPSEHAEPNDILNCLNMSLPSDPHQLVPTVRFVETLQGLIRKMQAFKLDHIQYSLLSTAVLFYTGNIDNLGLLTDERIQELKRVYENVLTLLRQHMMNSASNDVIATPNRSSSSSSSNNSLSPSKSFVRDNVQVYSKLLRLLPTIYSIHKNLVHSLFCSCVGLDVDALIASMIATHHDCCSAAEKKQ